MPHPNPLTAEDLARITGRDGDDDLAEFAAALENVDQDAAFDEARAHLTARVWDQQSDINGNPADRILTGLTVPAGGAVVLVDRDGATQVLQPHRTDRPGMQAIPVDDAQAIADAIADGMAAEDARGAVLRQLPADLLTPADAGDGGVSPEPQVPPTVEELAATVKAQAVQITDLTDTIDGLITMITEGA